VRVNLRPNGSRAQRTRAEYENFVAESADALLRTAYLIVWDLTEAEDLVQECLIIVARRWPRVRKMDHPLAYGRRVLINLALDGAARRSRQRQELEHANGHELDGRRDERAVQELGLVDTRSELVQALGTLPPRQRAVLVLRYFEDLSEVQVAAALGCSVGTVKSTASRGLTRLQAAITPDRPSPSLSQRSNP
jgi:RNA polymerase sigma-70 factor (sigma-E family)